ncbi:MAG: MoxR-like ATPase, partial [Natronomonas sp.]
METDHPAQDCDAVIESVSAAVISDRAFLETVLMAMVARGHVLLEDVPGTGKTLTARSMANALGLSFSRVQFTPDLLPADVTGTYVFDEQEGDFEFREGPIFANVVLADEINRAPPKTQSALLEAMEERQVTVDGETHDLPEPFFVIATQNPVEQEGTFALPEAQVDRFMVKTSLGYPDFDGELDLLKRRDGRVTRSPSVETVLSTGEVLALQSHPEEIRVDE